MVRGFCGIICLVIYIFIMVNSNHAFVDPSEEKGPYEAYDVKNPPERSSENFAQKMASSEEWVQSFEEEVGVGLSGEIRREIAGVLASTDKPFSEALRELKVDLLKDPLNKPSARVIDEIIDYYKGVANDAVESKLFKAETPEDFQEHIDHSLKTTIHAASSGMEFKKSERITEAAFRIKEIFWQLDRELEIGLLTSDLEVLQKEIDWYVSMLKFDGRVFNNSVQRYYDLAENLKKE